MVRCGMVGFGMVRVPTAHAHQGVASGMNYRFELTGVTPILFHADDVEAADELGKWRKDPAHKNISVPGDDRSPAWTWITYLHHDGEHLAVPADVIMAALRFAGGQIIMKGQKTFKAASQSGLCVLDEFCEFRGPKGRVAIADIHAFQDEPFAVHAQRVKDLGFRLFVKRGTIGKSKNIRVRARFEEWSIRGRIEVLDEVITADVLRTMFEIAGSKAGFLDWRPNCSKPGPYGRATAKVVKA